ncbi:MAG: NAD-dependent epimerase/dehydratase family protein [Betaproteobacteria bacterium]
MKLLVLGGTRFLGRHLVDQALQRGHAVTLLHRGVSAQGMFPEAEHRLADRNGELAAALAGGTWDLAIDTSAYVPRHVASAAAVLAGRVGQVQLVSTISVYAADAPAPLTEDSPRAALAEPGTEAVTGETYGPLKALCEDVALQAFGPDRCLVVRPGLIVGPHDPTGRFSWWVRRFMREAGRSGEVLAPGHPSAPVQFIDARDLAAWMLAQAEAGGSGVYNLAGPVGGTTMGSLLETARATLSPRARLSWVDEPTLLSAGVAPWMGLPLWLPEGQATLHRTAIDRAVASGLTTRPVATTIRDTATWLDTLPGEEAVMPAPIAGGTPRPQPGLPAAQEAALLAAWRAR